MDDVQFNQLLEFLGYSWAGYRKVRKGVKKRIRRHMRLLECQDISAYMNLLKMQSEIHEECELLMTVPISRFFRDRQMWLLLESRWLPDIIAAGPSTVSVWSAGCAGGEEVYSFKIIWERLKKRFNPLPRLEILATDRHTQRIDRARRGIYNRSGLREVDARLRTEFFDRVRGSKQFTIKAELKNGIRWETGNLMVATPGSSFNVIFLRNNILTYCRPEDQISAFLPILSCLAPGGLFIIGCHESLPLKTGGLVSTPECSYVFRKTMPAA